jgi:hypothetical protein
MERDVGTLVSSYQKENTMLKRRCSLLAGLMTIVTSLSAGDVVQQGRWDVVSSDATTVTLHIRTQAVQLPNSGQTGWMTFLTQPMASGRKVVAIEPFLADAGGDLPFNGTAEYKEKMVTADQRVSLTFRIKGQPGSIAIVRLTVGMHYTT